MRPMKTATRGRQSSARRTSRDSTKFFRMTPKTAGLLPRVTLTTMPSWCSVTRMRPAAAAVSRRGQKQRTGPRAASLGLPRGPRRLSAVLRDQQGPSFPAAEAGRPAGMLRLANSSRQPSSSSSNSSALLENLLRTWTGWRSAAGASRGVPRGVASCRRRRQPSRAHQCRWPPCGSGARPHHRVLLPRQQLRRLPAQPHPWTTWAGARHPLRHHLLLLQLPASPRVGSGLPCPPSSSSRPRTILGLGWAPWPRPA